MALFSRSLKPAGEAGTPLPIEESGSAASRRRIGDLLRETRLSYGGELDRIAATLRIRASYLVAIEEGAYDKLPGLVYALGFVRAYAMHLGLDGDEAVRRFKQETANFDVARDLSFPVPLSERSIPGGTMVLAALILAICGYGVWYYVSTGDRERPEKVSAVPSDLAPPAVLPPAASPTTTADTGPAAAATPAPSSAPPLAAAPPPSPGPLASATPSPSPAVPPPVAAVPAAPAPFVPPAAPPLGSAQAPAPALAATPQAPPSSTPAQDAGTPAAVAATPAAPPDQPHVYGAVGTDARVILRATKDSWVQIRDDTQTLVQRTLHPGDSVLVPDEPNLFLATGNASGLTILVDGKTAPALGGTVHHDVSLDPNRLSGGTALAN